MSVTKLTFPCEGCSQPINPDDYRVSSISQLGDSLDWEIAHNDCGKENYIYHVALDRFDTAEKIVAWTAHVSGLARWKAFKWNAALRRIEGLRMNV